MTFTQLCLIKTWPLRKQLLAYFLTLSGVSLLLALSAVLITTVIIGKTAETKARQSLEHQIERHLKETSIEAAATIGERFRRVQYAVLDVTTFTLKDALQENFVLYNGSNGYPLSPAHTDLRETQILTHDDANLQPFYRADVLVDLGRSSWYYSDNITANAVIEGNDDLTTISNTARLDLLWPTMYLNSNDTDSVYVAVPQETASGAVFRIFPGRSLSSESDTLFACNPKCYDPTVRPWYEAAEDAAIDKSTGLGSAIITDPYIDAIETETTWMVTLARAVYDDDSLLGVVGVDIRLEQLQLSVEGIHFLTSGYSLLATAEEGNVVAAPDTIWDRRVANNTDTVCNLESSICSGESGWEDLIALTQNQASKFTNNEGKKYILVTAPVQATYDLETGDASITHYILSAVPEAEIFESVEGMTKLIRASRTKIVVTTGIVALATLATVAAAVIMLAGKITHPIKTMTEAARSIAKDGAKTNVFGGVAADWGIGRKDGNSSVGASSSHNQTCVVDCLLCRGEDEIDTLVHEFSLMITGLGRRGKASTATGLGETTVYPKNPFTTSLQKAPPTAPSSNATPSPAGCERKVSVP